MKKMLAMAIAAAMVISLTAGCGESKKQTADQGATDSQAAQVEVDQELAKIIEDSSHIGVGTAGQSLKRAIIAHDIAALAAEKGFGEDDAEALKRTFEETVSGMDEDAKSSVEATFSDGVFPLLDSVIIDGEFDSIKPLFDDAGVADDMEGILKTPGLAESYSSIKSAYEAMGNS